MNNKLLLKNRKRGATLIDVLMGTFVFSIILAGVMSGLKYSSSLSEKQDHISISNSVVSYIAEDIRNTIYAGISSGVLTTSYNIGGGKAHDYMDDLPGSSVSINVSEPKTGLKKITITLTYDLITDPVVLSIYVADLD